MRKLTLLELNNYLKTYGFLFQHAEIYGGLSSTYDFGPIGAYLKNEIKKSLIKFFVEKNPLIHLMDSGILTHEKVLNASGHLKTFQNKPLFLCSICNKRKEIEEDFNGCDFCKEYKCSNCKKINKINQKIIKKEFDDYILKEKCSYCLFINIIGIQKNFNLLFFSEKGNSIENIKKQYVYLRPETAQGIFINAAQIARSLKLKIPFGLAQIGKAFRNEITTEKLIFRVTEFEQMEIEFFCEDNTKKNSMYWFNEYVKQINIFLKEILNINEKNIRENRQTTGIAHYSKITYDFEYKYSFGWKEIWGLSHRGQYDLTNHKINSKKTIEISNSKGEKIIPIIIEPSVGIERLMLSMLFEFLYIDENKKIILLMNEKFCYYNIAVLPLTEKLNNEAYKIFEILNKIDGIRVVFHSKKSIGKRYFYHDAIGTKFCITYDFDSKLKKSITIRDRNNKEQKRIDLIKLTSYIKIKLNI